MRRRIVLLAVVALLMVGSSPAAIRRAVIDGGEVEGLDKGEVTAFLGVPFAAPPLSDLRWRPPQPVASWSGTRGATEFSPSCMQRDQAGGFGPWTPEYIIPGGVSEDCLYLNVWTAAGTPGDKLPVLFWIHGGGYNSGSGSVPVYEGQALARRGIVVVTVNYRVGVLGFLAHPELTAESGHDASGNYGLLDLVAALKWTQANITAMGGDPSRVTIAGQSAGASAVQTLLASPLAKGLFHRAIIQSGPGGALALRTGLEAAEKAGAAYMKSKGVDTIEALRRLPADGADLRGISDGTKNQQPALGRFGPVLDGWYLPRNWPSDGSQPEAHDGPIPVMGGVTADEGSFAPNYGRADRAEFERVARQRFGSLADEFLELYPIQDDSQAGPVIMEATRDRYRAGTYTWAADRLAAGQGPTYIYLWGHTEPGNNSDHYRAFHSSEIPYVFDTLGKADRPYAEEDQRIANLMAAYWANFVKSGDPNGEGLPAWPAVKPASPLIMELGTSFKAAPVADPRKLDFFTRHIRSSEGQARGWLF